MRGRRVFTFRRTFVVSCVLLPKVLRLHKLWTPRAIHTSSVFTVFCLFSLHTRSSMRMTIDDHLQASSHRFLKKKNLSES